VQTTTGESGIYLRNRGEDLTVRRLDIRQQSNETPAEPIDATKPRVRLLSGHIVYGQLFVEDGQAHALDDQGQRKDIDLAQLDRIARPDAKLDAPITNHFELTYTDGSLVRGQFIKADSEQVTLQTAFAKQPVTSTLAGAAMLRFNPPASKSDSRHEGSDQLFSAAGLLRGQLSFDHPDSPLSWKSAGAAASLRLANDCRGRIQRSKDSLEKEPAYDTEEFPSLIYLKNGETIPCRITAYNETTLDFQSPFITKRQIASSHLKAIEFNPPKRASRKEAKEDWLTKLPGPESATNIDPTKLGRALTVPRFKRKSPPSHLLVAKNGDLKRGKLLAINGKTVQFESKLRKMTAPIERLALVVHVSPPGEDEEKEHTDPKPPKGHVRFKLANDSVLVFEPTESKGATVSGRSTIYGDVVAIPTGSIKELTFGNFDNERFQFPFEEWIVHPANEPEFGN
jgi:hypothetical protein